MKPRLGIAVIKDPDGSMKGRIIKDKDQEMLITQFGPRFQVPTIIGQNFTIGNVNSTTGVGFRELPGEAIFGVLLPVGECDLLVYADKEPDEFQQVIDALGGIETFKDAVVHTGNTYTAIYPGGSGSWEVTCT